MIGPSLRLPAGERFAIVEDHLLVADGLRRIVVEEISGVVTYVGSDLAKACPAEDLPDWLLLDVELGGFRADPNRVAVLLQAGVHVIVCSALTDPEALEELLLSGVRHVVPKTDVVANLLQAVDCVSRGQPYLDPALLTNMPRRIQLPDLSDREAESVRLYASGLKMAAVAHQMGVSVPTARTYVERAKNKYAAVGRPISTKTDLYREAVRDGLIIGP